MPVIYHKTLAEFRRDISANRIADEIKASGYEDEVGTHPSPEEENAWRNSLGALCKAINDLDDNLDIYAEYALPPDSLYRADVIITGLDANGNNTAVIIELKQWSDGSICLRKDQPEGSVHAKWNNDDEEFPSLQLSRYKHHLKTHCISVRDDIVTIHTCAFLHNYSSPAGRVNDPLFSEVANDSLAFFKGQGDLLAGFISNCISSPDSGKTIDKLENPDNHIMDPKLIDTVYTTLQGGKSFRLTFNQKKVFSEVINTYDKISETTQEKKKTVVVITGAPGTGKTVLALHLMGHFRKNGLKVRYVTLSKSLRYLFIDKLCSDHKEMERKKGHCLTPGEEEGYKLGASAMITPPFFKPNARFCEISVVDEAHRLTRMEHNKFNPWHYDNQAEFIIENSMLSVFLIDDDQQVRWEDYCTTAIIEEYAKQNKYEFIRLNLKNGIRQYTPYIKWVTALFSPSPIRLKMNPRRFLVKVYDKASELYSEIVQLNEAGHRSRMLAGYCWKWNTIWKNKSSIRQSERDIKIYDRKGNLDLQLIWNLRLKKNEYGETWIGRDDSIDEVGCIHTAQGVDMDYVGVIIGEDIKYNERTGRVEFHVEKHPDDDESVIDKDNNRQVDPQNAERLIRNAYRVLMTRSTKGCLIYCVDKDLSDYIKAHLR